MSSEIAVTRFPKETDAVRYATIESRKGIKKFMPERRLGERGAGKWFREASCVIPDEEGDLVFVFEFRNKVEGLTHFYIINKLLKRRMKKKGLLVSNDALEIGTLKDIKKNIRGIASSARRLACEKVLGMFREKGVKSPQIFAFVGFNNEDNIRSIQKSGFVYTGETVLYPDDKEECYVFRLSPRKLKQAMRNNLPIQSGMAPGL